jgi:hypothetical protein
LAPDQSLHGIMFLIMAFLMNDEHHLLRSFEDHDIVVL